MQSVVEQPPGNALRSNAPDIYNALLVTAQVLPPGTAIPVVRETLIELLSGSTTQPTPPTERWLPAADVATMLSTTERWVYSHAGQLGGKRLSRRCLRFPEMAVRRYLERRR